MLDLFRDGQATGIMKRSPLRRRTPLKRGAPLARGRALRPLSDKRRDDLPVRAEVRRIVLARDGGCTGRGVIPTECRSPFPDRAVLEVHEIIPRGRWRAGWLEPSNCVSLCQLMHDWVTENPAAATELGFLLPAHASDEMKLEAAARRRGLDR